MYHDNKNDPHAIIHKTIPTIIKKIFTDQTIVKYNVQFLCWSNGFNEKVTPDKITRKNIDSYMRIVLVMQRYFYQMLSVVSEPKFELYIFNYFF